MVVVRATFRVVDPVVEAVAVVGGFVESLPEGRLLAVARRVREYDLGPDRRRVALGREDLGRAFVVHEHEADLAIFALVEKEPELAGARIVYVPCPEGRGIFRPDKEGAIELDREQLLLEVVEMLDLVAVLVQAGVNSAAGQGEQEGQHEREDHGEAVHDALLERG